MKFEGTDIEGVYLIHLTPFQDDRGMFARVFCKNEFAVIRENLEFVQVNFSQTVSKGTVRGMHFQYPPHAESKLIRCIRGKILDVVVDIRENSPTFLQHVAVELSEENKTAIFVPEGFAHGFQTLEPNTELLYQHTSFYTPGAEGALNYKDPALNIAWPMEVTELSEKDKNTPFLTPDFKGIHINTL